MKWRAHRDLVLACLVVSGCAGPGTAQFKASLMAPLNKADQEAACPDQNTNIYFAKPVCVKYTIGGSLKSAGDVDSTGTAADKITFISYAIEDSERKCQKFIGLFTGAQAADNTVMDVSALILSGLATVFTPASTVRGLAAASTAVQGTKQAVNSDLYQQMTMLLLVQQINSTYYEQIDNEFRTWPPTGAALASLSASAELSKIQIMHRNCSIPFAAANISSTQTKQAVTAPSTADTSFAIAISGSVTIGDVIKLTASSASGAGFPVSISHAVAAGDTVVSIANDLISKTYGNMVFAQAGVSALRGNMPAGGSSAQFTLGGGPSDIAWSKTLTGVGGAAPTENVTITPPKGGA